MFPKRIYTVSYSLQSVTTAGGDRDLFYAAPADDKPILLLAWNLDQISDVGDAAEEVLQYSVIRGHTTVGSGGAAATPAPVNPSDVAAGFTARTNDTTIASAGTGLTLYSGAFNIRAGERIWLPPELWLPCSQAQGSIVIRLTAAPADDVTMSGTAWFAELG